MSEVSQSFQGKPLTVIIFELSRENQKSGKLVFVITSLPTFLRTFLMRLVVILTNVTLKILYNESTLGRST